jgi:hypothetical protein
MKGNVPGTAGMVPRDAPRQLVNGHPETGYFALL